MKRQSLKAYHAKKNNMITGTRLTKEQDKIIKATHGHSSGDGLSLFSVYDKKKVLIVNPTYIKHGNTLFAKGQHNGHMVSQIVKHKD